MSHLLPELRGVGINTYIVHVEMIPYMLILLKMVMHNMYFICRADTLFCSQRLIDIHVQVLLRWGRGGGYIMFSLHAYFPLPGTIPVIQQWY